MKAKEILMTGLTASAFLLAPTVFAEEGAHARKEMKSDAHQESSEATSSKQKQAAESSQQTREQTQRKASDSHVLKAGEVIGYTVKNSEGQELGEIEELVIDPEHGRISYAVLSFGGFLGMGDKLFAVPWDAMKAMPEQQTLRLDVAKEKLEKAPGFNKDNWPDLANREWGSVVYKYYDLDPYWQ